MGKESTGNVKNGTEKESSSRIKKKTYENTVVCDKKKKTIHRKRKELADIQSDPYKIITGY